MLPNKAGRFFGKLPNPELPFTVDPPGKSSRFSFSELAITISLSIWLDVDSCFCLEEGEGL